MARIDAPEPALPTTPARPALGTMHMGTRLDDRASFALLDRFVELGGHWLDTSETTTSPRTPQGSAGRARAPSAAGSA